MLSPDLNEARATSLRHHRRRMSSLLLLSVGLFVLSVIGALFYFILQPVTLRIAVGPQGSDDEKLIQGLARAFNRPGTPVRLTPVLTQSTPESIRLLGSGKVDLAVARGDLDLPDDAESVAIVRKNLAILWVGTGRAGKHGRGGIREIGDLAGKHVGVIGRTPANAALLRVILTESGVNPAKVTITQFDEGDVAKMAVNQDIDAFMAVGSSGSKAMADAIAATVKLRGEPRFLPVDVSETIAEKHPLYESEKIPANTFSTSPARPADEVETVSVNHLIIAAHALPETAVGAFIRQLFAVRPALSKELASAGKIEKPDTDKDAALPAHQGAAAYIDGTERTFLEKYSDYLWASILLLSALGSAGAWTRHYFKRNEKEENAVHRDRLLATILKVRQADSLDELAAMQGEVDTILRETLDCYDDGAIEAADLAAFGLVLEQFHHAVSDRRAALADSRSPPQMAPRTAGRAVSQ